MPQAAMLEQRNNMILFPGVEQHERKFKDKVRPSDRRREVTAQEREGKKSAHSFHSAAEVSLMLSDFLTCGEWRDALLFVTGLNTKFRAIDLSLLRWEDIIDEDYKVRPYWWFTEQKTGKSVRVVSNEAFTRMVNLYMRKVGAPKEFVSFVFMPDGNRKCYFHRWKDRCDDYTEAKMEIVRRIKLYRDRGIEPILEDYSRQQVHVVFADCSTIDWPYNRQGKLWIREQRHSDIPVGLSPETISEVIKKKAEKLGLYDTEGHRITAHTMRKTAATAARGLLPDRIVPSDLYNNTVPLDEVSRFMGHSNAAITVRYLAEDEMDEKIYRFINLGIEAIEEFETKEGLADE